MPQKLHWSRPRDAALIRLRQQARSWDAIAQALSISRNAAMERGRRLGARLPPRVAAAVAELEDPNRAPLPAGHPTSWAVLTEGTLLADSPYPPPRPVGRIWECLIGKC